MNERIDAVLSYHMNGATCGVAKFNHRLAKELGVPCLELGCPGDPKPSYPLISIKSSEMKHWTASVNAYPSRALMLHDAPELDAAAKGAIYASHPVYAVNPVIARHLRRVKPDIIEAWCPSTIDGNPTRGAINVLTFGMAHKIQTARYEKLKALLDATGEDYTVSVSTAIHEGSPWDETAAVGERLRGIFGSQLRVLGYLADDALAKELRECTAIAMFFDPAVRANNTTFWAAVEAGKPIVTNIDADSPLHVRAVAVDINDVSWLPGYITGQTESARVRIEGQDWDALTSLLQGQPCAK